MTAIEAAARALFDLVMSTSGREELVGTFDDLPPSATAHWEDEARKIIDAYEQVALG